MWHGLTCSRMDTHPPDTLRAITFKTKLREFFERVTHEKQSALRGELHHMLLVS